MVWGGASHFACCLRVIFGLDTHAGQSFPFLGLEKLPEIAEMFLSSLHTTSSFIPRTLVLKTFQGGASHLGLALGVGVGGKGDMCLISSSG